MWQVRAGSTLIAWLVGKDGAGFVVDTAYPTPKDVRAMIEGGIGKGWTYSERGANVALTSTDDIRLNDLNLLSFTQMKSYS